MKHRLVILKLQEKEYISVVFMMVVLVLRNQTGQLTIGVIIGFHPKKNIVCMY
jgi:hypothetical protein